jgi:hypothetical protein
MDGRDDDIWVHGLHGSLQRIAATNPGPGVFLPDRRFSAVGEPGDDALASGLPNAYGLSNG